MAFCRHFLILFWKNLILQRRKTCVTVFEILLPLVCTSIMIIARHYVVVRWMSGKNGSITFKQAERSDMYGPMFNAEILYAPNDTGTYSIVHTLDNRTYASVRGFIDEKSLVQFASNAWNSDQYIDRKYGDRPYRKFGGLVLQHKSHSGAQEIPRKLQITIRPSSSDSSSNYESWSTKTNFNFKKMSFGMFGPSDMYSKAYSGAVSFLGVQRDIGRAVITQISGSTNHLNKVMIQLKSMPEPGYQKDYLVLVLQFLLPQILILSFILNSLQVTRSLVHEKQSKLKEMMKMMGLTDLEHWCAWFAKCFLYQMIIIGAITILLSIKYPLKDYSRKFLAERITHASVFQNSNMFIVFLFLMCFSMASITFCFLISTLFKSANVAAGASFILYILTYIPYNVLVAFYPELTYSQKMASCLLTNTAMGLGTNVILMHERNGVGLQWSNISEPGMYDDNFTMADVFLMLLVDITIHLILTWYVDAVHPGEFGTPRPWYFPCMRSYWCGTKPNDAPGPAIAETGREEFFEAEPKDLPLGISIKNLKKVFRKGGRKNIAVAGVSLNMYEGQITALLGHNGAGKTTTIHMLTGFLTTTDGTALVNGYDIHDDMPNVRKNLGLCHQHSVLFDSLTVEEHLLFCAKLKGTPSSCLKSDILNTLTDIGMLQKKNTYASHLSGGEKRKLSVGMALVGDTKVVVLDEPTSGMDPEARRNLWTILNKAKVGRTILLTTHYMEEADILGDRIAIMAEGVVKCCGSSLFLKNKYGSGYHLTMVKVNSGQGTSCDTSVVTQTVKSHVPQAHLEGDIAAELTYTLPYDASPMFQSLFRDLEQRGPIIGISGFGVSVTTLEEVFLRVGEGATDDPDMLRMLKRQVSIEHKGSGDMNSTSNQADLHRGEENMMECDQIMAGNEDVPLAVLNKGNIEHRIDIDVHQGLVKSSGIMLLGQQCFGILRKKMLYSWRNKTTLVVQFLVPVLFTIFALLIEAASDGNFRDDNSITAEPARILDMSPFRENRVIYHMDKNASLGVKDMARAYESLFKDSASKLTQINDNVDDYLKDVGERIGRAKFNTDYLLGATFEENNAILTITMHHNKNALHMQGIAMTYAINTLIKHMLGSEYTVDMVNHPLPWKPRERRNSRSIGMAGNLGLAFGITFTLIFGLSLMSTTFVITPIRERNTGAKHIQFVSGCRPFSYWIPSFVWDFLFFLISIISLLIVFAAFQSEAYSKEGRLGVVFVMFVMYAWGMLPFLYVGQFPFRTPAGGTVALTMLNVFTGLGTLLTVFLLEMFRDTKDVAKTLKWFFSLLFPNYCLAQSFINVFINHSGQKVCASSKYRFCNSDCSSVTGDNDTPLISLFSGSCIQVQDSYFTIAEPGIGRYLLLMFIQGIAYLTIVFVIEYRLVKRIFYCASNIVPTVISSSAQEDSDVTEENKRIRLQGQQLRYSESLVLDGFSKQYGSLLAVDHLNLSVGGGQCFGLLGVNGAGKTSTFKMLTGQELISDGNAFLNGYDVKHSMSQLKSNPATIWLVPIHRKPPTGVDPLQVHQQLGYCPQDDVLIGQLTGREHLTLISRLRGVKESMIKKYVDKMMTALTLDEHADKRTSAYSGGNKRKLTTAIALIGDPPVLFLDEPTTGVDPAARRQLWNVLFNLRDNNRTLILTSHSMEECDALCTRIAIMVNGRFLCLGSPQHLKSKFGKGYTLLARIGTDETGVLLVQPFTEFLAAKYPTNCRLMVEENYVTFQITDPSILLSDIFGTLEGCREQFKVEDYSVNQTTLQEVFIEFAKMQNAQRPPVKFKCCGCCCCCRDNS